MTEARALVPNTAAADFDPPPALLPYQQRWIADESNLKVAEKGRRTGLTWAEAADDVLIAATEKSAGGQNVYYIGTDKEMTEEYIQACAMWAKAFNYAAGSIGEGFWDEDDEDKHIKTFTIRFPGSGFKITALASRPRKLRGRQGVLVGDEAAFQDNLDELLKAALAFLIWGGKVRLISTHDGVDNQFNSLISEIRGGKRRGSVHRITFAQAVDEGLFVRVCMRLGKEWTQDAQDEWVREIYATYGDAAAEELDCIPANSGGAFISRALVESRMSADTPVLRLALKNGFELLPEATRRMEIDEFLQTIVLPHLLLLDKERAHSFGLDFGRLVDLSVFVPLVTEQSLRRRPPFTVELRNVPFENQKQILHFMVDRLPRFSGGAMDATGNGLYLAEVAMQRYGSRILQVKLSESWYAENMPVFKTALQEGMLDGLPKDADVLDDFRAVQVIRGVPKVADLRSTDQNKGKRHGDSAVAFCLAWHASSLGFAPIDFQSIGQRAAVSAYDSAPARPTDAGFGSIAGGNDFGGFA